MSKSLPFPYDIIIKRLGRMHIKHIDAKNENYYHASQNACIQLKEKLNKLGYWKSEI